MSERPRHNLPLAERMRPDSLEELIGQGHLFEEGGLIASILKTGQMPSLLIYGPAGTGKTSLARLLSKHFSSEFVRINAVLSNIKELRSQLLLARARLKNEGKNTVLFIDEIHRFSSVQQDALLPYVEERIISFIGASIDNPMFAVVPALVSRCLLVELKKIPKEQIISAMDTALKRRDKSLLPEKFNADKAVLTEIANLSDGDLRKAYNILELLSARNKAVSPADVKKLIGKKALYYDKNAANHYNNISAFIKAMRAGREKEAVYWLAKMLYSGEDPRFIARRIVIFAAEDIGLAVPGAIAIAQATFDAVSVIGMPEARIILSNAAIYMSRAKKSRESYNAIENALSQIENEYTRQVPNFSKH